MWPRWKRLIKRWRFSNPRDFTTCPGLRGLNNLEQHRLHRRQNAVFRLELITSRLVQSDVAERGHAAVGEDESVPPRTAPSGPVPGLMTSFTSESSVVTTLPNGFHVHGNRRRDGIANGRLRGRLRKG